MNKILLAASLCFIFLIQNSFAQVKTFNSRAVFAGGCFWCMQYPFDALIGKGVLSTKVGYTGGQTKNPSYEEVSSGKSGHLEAIEIVFDSKKISYLELLRVFWKNIDPFDSKGQFCDKGEQYTSSVFFVDDEQKKAYTESLKELEKSGQKIANIVTKTLPFKVFYSAEEYHQKYYEKNPIRYKLYRYNCGRDKRLNEVWGNGPAH